MHNLKLNTADLLILPLFSRGLRQRWRPKYGFQVACQRPVGNLFEVEVQIFNGQLTSRLKSIYRSSRTRFFQIFKLFSSAFCMLAQRAMVLSGHLTDQTVCRRQKRATWHKNINRSMLIPHSSFARLAFLMIVSLSSTFSSR